MTSRARLLTTIPLTHLRAHSARENAPVDALVRDENA